MIPLLILGLLKEQPASYGYELLAKMEANYFEYFVRFTKGSFYYNIQQLEAKGLIERVFSEPQKEGKEKNRYTLTATGEKEFKRLFLRYGEKNEPITFPFYTPLLFEDQVASEQMVQLLEGQIAQTQEKIRLIEAALANPAEQLRPNFLKMMENSRQHHEVNLAWFQEQLAEYK